MNKIEEETFHANRPFMFYIEDESTGTILYMGKIINPLVGTESESNPKPEFPSKFGPGIPDAG